jgi:hypothetical protein
VYGEKKKKRRRRKREEGNIRQARRGHSLLGGVAASERASDIRAVCLYPSFFDQREEHREHIPTNGLAWQTRTAGMGEEACLHFALRSRHDLHHAIGWWDAWKRVVNGVD